MGPAGRASRYPRGRGRRPILILLAVLLTAAPSVAQPAAPTDGRALAADIARVGSGHVTIIAYDVGIGGNVTHCSVFQSSGAPELDQRACAIFLEKARFSPKRDTRGRAVPDLGRKTRILWNIAR